MSDPVCAGCGGSVKDAYKRIITDAESLEWYRGRPYHARCKPIITPPAICAHCFARVSHDTEGSEPVSTEGGVMHRKCLEQFGSR